MGRIKTKKDKYKYKTKMEKNWKNVKIKRCNKIIDFEEKKHLIQIIINIIKAISPRLKSEILNEIIRPILSKAELVF